MMKKYAYIYGDDFTKFEPVVFVYENGKYEVICQSFTRQKNWYDYLKNTRHETFESFLSSFSYQNVDTGEVTADVESTLNKLRARFALYQVADESQNAETQQNPEDDRRANALMRISKRMRTGANER